MSATPVNPPTLATPRGYAHGMVGQGRLLAIAGQIGWDGAGQLVSADFVAQFGRALGNVVAVLEEAGGSVHDLLQLRLFVTDKRLYVARLKEVGAVYREQMAAGGKVAYPAMALVEVAGLLEPGALVEIEGLAVLA